MIDDLKTLFNGAAFLAPMLAVADFPFRTICRELGAGLVTTEMVSARGILEDNSISFRSAAFDAIEQPIAVQIVASEPDVIGKAIPKLLPFHPTVFDLNCGCPNERICEVGAGAQLLADLKLLRATLQAAVAASPIPVSAKVRTAGQHRDEGDIRDIAQAVEDGGASYLTVHARGRFTPYSQPAAWDLIGIAKQNVSIPVVGNGDVFSVHDAQALKCATGCDAVMIARGALGNPWIFRDIALSTNEEVKEIVQTNGEIVTVIHRHIALLLREFGPILSLPRIRKHILWYARRFEAVDELRRLIFAKDDAGWIDETVLNFFDNNPVQLTYDSDRWRQREKQFRDRVLYWIAPSGIASKSK